VVDRVPATLLAALAVDFYRPEPSGCVSAFGWPHFFVVDPTGKLLRTITAPSPSVPNFDISTNVERSLPLQDRC